MQASVFQPVFTQDTANGQMHIERKFAASQALVWRAFTNPDLLELWWAPRPYKAVTKAAQIQAGGFWQYFMESPEGERHYCRTTFESFTPISQYQATDRFEDIDGNPTDFVPSTHWVVNFSTIAEGTLVSITITYPDAQVMAKFVEMGFVEGFSMAFSNLDEVLLIGGQIVK